MSPRPSTARAGSATTRTASPASLAALPQLPTPVWGLDELHAGEMWNSNSVISWLLARADLAPEHIRPPVDGRAPGWDAGHRIARRG